MEASAWLQESKRLYICIDLDICIDLYIDLDICIDLGNDTFDDVA